MNRLAPRSRLRVSGLSGLVTLSLSLVACSSPAPEVAFAPVEPGGIEVTPAPSLFARTELSEIIITPLSEDPEFRKAQRAATVASAKERPAAPVLAVHEDEAAKAWLDGMASSAAAEKEAAVDEPAAPSLTAAMGAGIATEGTEFSPDFAPMRKSFTSRSAAATTGDAVASISLDSQARAGGTATREVTKRVAGPSGLEPAAIKRIVSRQRARVRACYERALKTETHLEGRLRMAWSVTPSGDVQSVRVVEDGLGSEFVAKCVTHAVSQFRFPETSETTEIEYPMVFEPGKTF